MKTIKKLNEIFRLKRKKYPIYYFIHDIYWKIYYFIDMLPLNIKSFYLRGKYGFSPKDTWDFDNYLATVISQGLKHFKKYYHGKEPTKKEIQTIINGFEANLKMMNNNLQYNQKSKEYMILKFKFHRGMILLERYFNYLWD
jgi:hypothetical protein